jgi:hypothetical protein
MAERSADAVDQPAIYWTVHPLAEEPWTRTAALVLLTAGASAAAAIGFEGLGYGVLSLGVLGASMARYWLPTRYRLDDQGAWVIHLGRRRHWPWAGVRRVEILRRGVFLSPFGRPSRLDSFRGCYLRCGVNRAEVAGFAEKHLES